MIKTVRRVKVKPENPLVLTQLEAQAEADDLLAAMSVLAFAPKDDDAKLNVRDTSTQPKWKSRFFFKPSVSFYEKLEQSKKTFKPKALEHIDAEIEKRLSVYKSTMPKALRSNIVTVREFFLKEIAPLTLASDAGTSQAKDVVQRLLGTPVDEAMFVKYDRMLHTAVNIAMAKFIASYLKLPKGSAEELLLELKPKPSQPFIIPVPQRENHEVQKPNPKS